LVAAHAMNLPSFFDPFLGIRVWMVVLLVGGLELAVALVCLFTRRLELQLTLVAWLAVNFFAYGICLVLTHYSPQASGIGSLTDPLGLSRGVTGMVLQWIPYYLLAGSLAGLVWGWLEPRRARVAVRQKTYCPSCGAHIEFDSQDLGRKIPCPLCRATLALRAPENLKMCCSFCHEHVEFPAHALGQQFPCPHCNMEITLKEPV